MEDENLCGSCTHINQTRDGMWRWCELKKELRFCLDKPCRHYEDVWQKDMFGEYSLHDETVSRQRRLMKNR